jgi:hypothetical protein
MQCRSSQLRQLPPDERSGVHIVFPFLCFAVYRYGTKERIGRDFHPLNRKRYENSVRLLLLDLLSDRTIVVVDVATPPILAVSPAVAPLIRQVSRVTAFAAKGSGRIFTYLQSHPDLLGRRLIKLPHVSHRGYRHAADPRRLSGCV